MAKKLVPLCASVNDVNCLPAKLLSLPRPGSQIMPGDVRVQARSRKSEGADAVEVTVAMTLTNTGSEAVTGAQVWVRAQNMASSPNDNPNSIMVTPPAGRLEPGASVAVSGTMQMAAAPAGLWLMVPVQVL